MDNIHQCDSHINSTIGMNLVSPLVLETRHAVTLQLECRFRNSSINSCLLKVSLNVFICIRHVTLMKLTISKRYRYLVDAGLNADVGKYKPSQFSP
jgi:hypothetical protein